MNDIRLPKILLYGELPNAPRKHGRPIYVLKTSLRAIFRLSPSTWTTGRPLQMTEPNGTEQLTMAAGTLRRLTSSSPPIAQFGQTASSRKGSGRPKRLPFKDYGGHCALRNLKQVCGFPTISSSSAHPGPGRGGSSLSRDAQTSLSLDTSSSSSGGILRRSQATRETVSPACPRSSPGPPPSGTYPEHLPRKASRRHSEQMPEPPQLTPLYVEEQRLYSELLPSDRASHPISKGPPSHPAEKAHFGRLYPGSCPFGHDHRWE
ncbi:hypothetical protein F2P79_025073 [Pimephales promelas]|nr:hypothetical protein F2P79_025073 [Pimephales promelas]